MIERIIPIAIVVVIALLVDFIVAIVSIGIETVLSLFFDIFNNSNLNH